MILCQGVWGKGREENPLCMKDARGKVTAWIPSQTQGPSKDGLKGVMGLLEMSPNKVSAHRGQEAKGRRLDGGGGSERMWGRLREDLGKS